MHWIEALLSIGSFVSVIVRCNCLLLPSLPRFEQLCLNLRVHVSHYRCYTRTTSTSIVTCTSNVNLKTTHFSKSKYEIYEYFTQRTSISINKWIFRPRIYIASYDSDIQFSFINLVEEKLRASTKKNFHMCEVISTWSKSCLDCHPCL